jgi:hypothetical protein
MNDKNLQDMFDDSHNNCFVAQRDKTKDKIRQANVGKPKPPMTDEHRKKISQALTGKKHTSERSAQKSSRQKGKSTWSKGKKQSAQHKENIRLAMFDYWKRKKSKS